MNADGGKLRAAALSVVSNSALILLKLRDRLPNAAARLAAP